MWLDSQQGFSEKENYRNQQCRKQVQCLAVLYADNKRTQTHGIVEAGPAPRVDSLLEGGSDYAPAYYTNCIYYCSYHDFSVFQTNLGKSIKVWHGSIQKIRAARRTALTDLH